MEVFEVWIFKYYELYFQQLIAAERADVLLTSSSHNAPATNVEGHINLPLSVRLSVRPLVVRVQINGLSGYLLLQLLRYSFDIL